MREKEKEEGFKKGGWVGEDMTSMIMIDILCSPCLGLE